MKLMDLDVEQLGIPVSNKGCGALPHSHQILGHNVLWSAGRVSLWVSL